MFSKLLDNIGKAEMEQEVQNRVIKIVREQEQTMKDETGISTSMQENDIKVYLEQVIKEVKKQKGQPLQQ